MKRIAYASITAAAVLLAAAAPAHALEPAPADSAPAVSRYRYFGADSADRAVAMVAHRGASAYAPENTMAAFRQALAMNADYIELDVQLSKDGRLVVLHDATVDRTTDGKGEVRDLTFGELRRLDAGSWFGERFRGERIPSLEEVLDAFAGKVGLLIELKQPAASPGIERRLAGTLMSRQLDVPSEPGVIVQSFDTEALKKVKSLLPHIPVAVLVNRSRAVTTQDLLDYREYADAIHTRLTGLSRPLVDRIHSYGMSVMGWTVRNRRNVAALAAAGADGIMTDDPSMVIGRVRAHARAGRP